MAKDLLLRLGQRTSGRSGTKVDRGIAGSGMGIGRIVTPTGTTRDRLNQQGSRVGRLNMLDRMRGTTLKLPDSRKIGIARVGDKSLQNLLGPQTNRMAGGTMTLGMDTTSGGLKGNNNLSRKVTMLIHPLGVDGPVSVSGKGL